MKWKVLFFQTIHNTCPVKKFIESLPHAALAKAIRTISLLERFGPYLKLPHSKKIRNNIWELRVIGKESIRILYTHHQNTYYLLHAFKKKSQKTPPKEIITAIDRANEII